MFALVGRPGAQKGGGMAMGSARRRDHLDYLPTEKGVSTFRIGK
jgi:hypothetical protein